ncbi:MAG: PAS domain S-box protein [Ignavibacteriales bacterium]|nr:PAS domain S-box protein [Ignavibacteriales bacterium]
MLETIRILYFDTNTDDVESVRSSLKNVDPGYQLRQVKKVKDFESELTNGNYDIVISDLQLNSNVGFEILDLVKSLSPNLPVLIFTHVLDDQTAIKAIKRGAVDYLIKSPDNIQNISISIKIALEKNKSQIAQEILTQTLRESEIRFRDIFDKATDGMLLADISSKKFILCNPNLCRMLRYSNEEILKLKVADIHPPESLEHVVSEFDRQARGEITSVLNIPVIRKDGSIFYADINSYPFYWEGNKCLMGVFRDITERKIAEENLIENEKKFRALTDTSVAAIVIYQDEKFVYVNPASEIITGYNICELMEMNFWDLVHTDQRDILRERGRARLQGKPVPSRYELKIVKKNGEIRWLDFNAGTIQYMGKTAAIGIGFDITKQKEAEEALKRSENKYRMLHESMIDAFVSVGMDGIIIEFNNAYITMLGYTADEILNLSYTDITPEKWHAYEAKIVAEQILPKGFSDVYEKEYRRKDGTIFPVELRTSLIRDENGKPKSMWAIVRDITERKCAEEKLNESYEQMRQLSARLQSIREKESTRIAREIHDELGQTLTGIKMDISFLEERLSVTLNLQKNPELVEKINSISDQTDSAVQTVRKITTELRPAILDSMGLSAAIEWQTEDFEHRTGITCRYFSPAEEFEINREVSTALFRIMQEALTNVIRHAKASHVEVKLKRNKDKIFFEVSDNGRGFNKSELDHLNSFGILGMKERTSLIGGSFEILSEPNRGTTIRVIIPLHSSTSAEHPHD